MHTLLRTFCLLLFVWSASLHGNNSIIDTDALSTVPVVYKGRFRPMETYARMWLYSIYHNEQISPSHLAAFHLNDGSAQELLWKMHFLGHEPWDNAPLFWISSNELKEALGLDTSENHFSYNILHQAIYNQPETSLVFLKPILIGAYLSLPNHGDRQELSSISPGLWVEWKSNNLKITAVPDSFSWTFLIKGTTVINESKEKLSKQENVYRRAMQERLELLSAMEQYANDPNLTEKLFEKHAYDLHHSKLPHQTIGKELDAQFPLDKRLAWSDSHFLALPGKQEGGQWLPLSVLRMTEYDVDTGKLVPIRNVTGYGDQRFREIRSSYQSLAKSIRAESADSIIDSKELAYHLLEGYSTIAGTSYKQASGKSISYPSSGQLNAEMLLSKYPLTSITLVLYLIAAIFLIGGTRYMYFLTGVTCLGAAFLLHTAILIMRSYVLERPPVSNMFETVIYVPWITVLVSIIFYFIFKSRLLLIASSLIATSLLIVLKASQLGSSLENVQAVLDSQYWLMTHVLLVVGSYGVFALCSLMGHVNLVLQWLHTHDSPTTARVNRYILNSMYVGLAMLIPGTILGGVWAAESWGRFWDWDPKESWAFISICIYVIWIHLYRFKHIGEFGLSLGAVAGFLAITFTWYGVNYILGTGLHSYGFGSGGELFYYGFIIADAIFLAIICAMNYNKSYKLNNNV